jgi:hypothetical protein
MLNSLLLDGGHDMQQHSEYDNDFLLLFSREEIGIYLNM